MSRRLPVHATPIALTALAALLWYSQFRLTFAGLSSPDQLDYAQIARHVWRGEGFVTSIAYPLTFSRFDSPRQPDFLRITLFPLLVAPLYGAFGVNDRAVVAVSALAYMLLPAAVFGLTRRLTASDRAATLAGLMMLLNQEILSFSLTGLSELAFTLALVVAFYCMARETRPGILGTALGVCYLLRMNFLLMLPGLVVFWVIAPPVSGWRYLVKVAGAAFLTISPWLIRNWLIVGQPLFSWQTVGYLALKTSSFPDFDVFRQIEPTDNLAFLRSHSVEVYEKALGNARIFYQVLPGLTHFLVMAGCIASLAWSGQKRRVTALRVAVFGMLIVQASVLLPVNNEIRFFVPLIPLLIVPAADFYERALTDSKVSDGLRRVAYAGMCLIMFLPLLPNYTGRVGRRDFDLVRQELAEPLGQCREAVVITDAAWPVAWYFDRPAVVIPLTFADLDRIERKLNRPVVVLFFYVGEQDRYQRSAQYQAEYFANADFMRHHQLAAVFDSGARLYRYQPPGSPPCAGESIQK